ncbi:MAG: tRNA-(ms[2]io[6]A)-hydroxylase [Flavobacteriales bacterium]|nr:MAG: tRNA-(ms[2]io[6]A)-hydroxylase [Flavobacteriales bacterium]
MKFSLELEYQTPKDWAEVVVSDFDAFLQDHADCERKASAMAMSFVAKCPDKVEIIIQLIDTALEELEHFKMVYEIMQKRGVQLRQEIVQDKYVNDLIALCRTRPEERLLDRMLLASIIECRGAERFRLVEEALEDVELKRFYKMLWASEAKHSNIFVEMALTYWPEDEVYKRLKKLNCQEASICRKLPLKPALH